MNTHFHSRDIYGHIFSFSLCVNFLRKWDSNVTSILDLVNLMDCNPRVSSRICNDHRFGTHESHFASGIWADPGEGVISAPGQRIAVANDRPVRHGKLNAFTVTTLDGVNSATVSDSDTSAGGDYQCDIGKRSCTHPAPEHSILDRKQIMNYRRALWVSGPDKQQLLSYLAFVEYLGFTAKKIEIIFTSKFFNDFIIKDEDGKLIDNIVTLSKIVKTQPVALKLSYIHRELIITCETLEHFEKGPFDAITSFFDQLATVDADYFLYSIKVILPSAEGGLEDGFWREGRTEADHVAEIYELVMSSGRSYKGSVGGYFWSKYHAYSFYDSLYGWMLSLHEPGSLTDIFTHEFSNNVIWNADWADDDKADDVNIYFHTRFLCAKAISWYGENYDDEDEDEDDDDDDVWEDPYYSTMDKIKSAANLLKQAEILAEEGRNPESFLSLVSRLPHVWKEIILLTGGSEMSYAEKEFIVLDFLYNRGPFQNTRHSAFEQ